MQREGESVGAAAGFAALAIGLAAALVPVRAQLGSANAALLLVSIAIVAGAVGGRVAGLTTALTASMSFNFFHTQPYLTLRIHSSRDIVTTALIMLVGFGVGELGVSRARQSATRVSYLRSMRTLEDVGASVSAGASAAEVWAQVRAALAEVLGSRSAEFTPGAERLELTYIERDGRLDVAARTFLGSGFALPPSGVALDVVADGRRLGCIRIQTDPAVSVGREQRRAAVAVADQWAIALRSLPTVEPRG